MLYLSSYNSSVMYLVSNEADGVLESLVPVRPPRAEAKDLDAECSVLIPDSFYVKYTFSGNYNESVGIYDINACSESRAALAGYR